MRIDVGALGGYSTFGHVAECPEISPPACAAEEIPPHRHEQTLTHIRPSVGFSLGVGKGWEIAASLPFDLKLATAEYTTLDGNPYVPPYGEIHHRDENLFGPGDGRLAARRTARGGPGWTWTAEAGSSLPFGKTEEDPFVLGDAGLTHQHFQAGTGTFVPLLAGGIWGQAGRFGGGVRLDARLPLYANGKGYLQGPQLILGTGPTWTIEKTTLSVPVDAALELRDRWAGVTAHDSGRVAILAGLGAMVVPTPHLGIATSLRTTVWQRPFEVAHEDEVHQLLIAMARLVITPPRKAPPASDEQAEADR